MYSDYSLQTPNDPSTFVNMGENTSILNNQWVMHSFQGWNLKVSLPSSFWFRNGEICNVTMIVGMSMSMSMYILCHDVPCVYCFKKTAGVLAVLFFTHKRNYNFFYKKTKNKKQKKHAKNKR